MRIALFLFAGCLALHLYFALEGWGRPLVGPHGFRQAQTAMGARSIAKSGFSIAPDLPVFGPPWAVPFEFPLYQIVTAGVHEGLGIPLEMAGRAVSLLMFYLCLIPAFAITRRCGLGNAEGVVAICFLLASPIYVFWSQAFLIESTALFLTLSFVACGLVVLAELERHPWRWVFAAVVFGVLAGLAKITTMTIGIGIIGLWSLLEIARAPASFRTTRMRLLMVMVVPLLAVPLMAAVAWTGVADGLKAQNPLAAKLISSELTEWTFGTWDQRRPLSLARHFYRMGILNAAGTLIPLFAAAAAFLMPGRRRRAEICILGIAFVAGPAVFANLYFVHSYYWYANAVYLLLAIGVLIAAAAAMLDARGHRVVGYALVVGVLATSWVGYSKHRFRETHAEAVQHRVKVGAKIAEVVAADEIAIMLGLDWDPSLAYQANRRALMIPDWLAPESYLVDGIERVQNAGLRIGGVVLAGRFLGEPPSAELLAGLRLSPEPAYADRWIQIFAVIPQDE